MVGIASLVRLLKVKGIRRRKKSEPVKDETRLPQEILNRIIEEYHSSYPQQPLYPLLTTSRSIYEATIPCLYRSIAFTIKQETRDRWPSLLMSLYRHGRLVRSLDLTEPMGPNDRTELSKEDLPPTFLDCLAGLSQLRKLSIGCLGAKLPTRILVAISQLPHLRSLRLINLSFIGADCDNLQLSMMEALREVLLFGVWEHDGSLKWSSFIPSTLNQSTQSFEYYQGSHSSTDGYSFLQILEEQPQLSFPEMRELRLPRPVTTVDVDRGLDLLRRCPSLKVLSFESQMVEHLLQRTWGAQINELGSRLPRNCLNRLTTIRGPPGLVASIAVGRPVRAATIRLDRQTEFPLLSTLEALGQSTAPLEYLIITTSKWRETSMKEIVRLFPQLRKLVVFPLSFPVMTMFDWDLDPLFDLRRLEELSLIRIDEDGGVAPGPRGTSEGRVNSLITSSPLLARSRVVIY